MLLRPRQKVFVERSLNALHEHGNTLAVASTGFGKTIALSAVVGDLAKHGAKSCVLAHRDELTAQNAGKFLKVNIGLSASLFDANHKSWNGDAIFAMVQTLARENNLKAMPKLDLLVIDEAHHAAANSYRKVIDAVQDKNPDAMIYGVTATPNRGDKKGLRPIFSNVADQVKIGELVKSGHLVPPKTYVVDVGAQEQLRGIKKTLNDFDMNEVDKILNKTPITDAVIKHWKEKAGDRQTVVFCSTVDHAKNVAESFVKAGFSAKAIYGDMGAEERKSTLSEFANGNIQVITNVAVLTEGWDHPPTSCVVLLRPSSYKSTMIQMVGRGLRTVCPEEFPGIVKTDCIVLDFGTSTLMHGSLEQDANLDGGDGKPCEAPTKDCPDCGAVLPLNSSECALCGYIWEKEEEGEEGTGSADEPLTDFVMTEVDLLKRSTFAWSSLFADDSAFIATGFNAWGGIFYLSGAWYAIGGGKGLKTHLLQAGEKIMCLAAADDWLNENEADDSAHKTKRWVKLPATDKQVRLLHPRYKNDFNLTRYKAACLITFKFNKTIIQKLLFNADGYRRAA